MENIRSGDLCFVESGALNDMPKNIVSRKNFHSYLVLKGTKDHKYLVAAVYYNNRRNYCVPFMLEGQKLWVDCAVFMRIDKNWLSPMHKCIEEEVIERVHTEHPRLHKKWEENQRRKKQIKRQRARTEKAWKYLEQGGKNKTGSKKYPYGTGLVRRVAPSSKGIRFVPGGGCTPR